MSKYNDIIWTWDKSQDNSIFWLNKFKVLSWVLVLEVGHWFRRVAIMVLLRSGIHAFHIVHVRSDGQWQHHALALTIQVRRIHGLLATCKWRGVVERGPGGHWHGTPTLPTWQGALTVSQDWWTLAKRRGLHWLLWTNLVIGGCRMHSWTYWWCPSQTMWVGRQTLGQGGGHMRALPSLGWYGWWYGWWECMT